MEFTLVKKNNIMVDFVSYVYKYQNVVQCFLCNQEQIGNC